MTVQSVLFVSSFISASVSPELISDLDSRIRLDLQHVSDSFFFWVAVSAIVVAIGCAMEGPELLHDLWPKAFRIFSGKWVKKVGFIGWFLIVLGVAAEGVFEVYDHQASDLLQTFDEVLLTAAQGDAGNAKLSAIDASAAAQTAREQSSQASVASANARDLSAGARREADTLTQEITAAKQQAADAVSRLADAEQRLADATQREANAEEELHRFKTPRSLIHTDELVAALKPFKGTEYTFNVFMDDESIQFTKTVAAALEAAGWVRKQPVGINLGIPTLQIVLGQGAAENVPACVDTGISLHAFTKESLTTLQSLPLLSEPKTIQAALALKLSIAPSISPADEQNVMNGFIDPKPMEGVPMTICVGKKP